MLGAAAVGMRRAGANVGIRKGMSYMADAMKATAGAIAGGVKALASGTINFVGGLAERSGNLLVGHGFRSDSEYQDYLVRTAVEGEIGFMGAGNDAFDTGHYLNNIPSEYRDQFLANGSILEGESQRNNMALTPSSTGWNMCMFTSTANALTDKFGITEKDGQKVIEKLVLGNSEDSEGRREKLIYLMKLDRNVNSNKFDEKTKTDVKHFDEYSKEVQDDVIRSWVSQIGQLEDTMDVIRDICDYGAAYEKNDGDSRRWDYVVSNVIRHFDMVANMNDSAIYTDSKQPYSNTYGAILQTSDATLAKESYQTLMEKLNSNDRNQAVILSTNLSGSGHIVRYIGMNANGIFINDPYGRHDLESKGSKGYKTSSQNQNYASTYLVPWEEAAKYDVGKRYMTIKRKGDWILPPWMTQ